MSQQRQLLDRFGQETALRPTQEQALLTALEERGLLPGDVGRALGAATAPQGTPRLRRPRPRPGRRWLTPVAIAALAGACLAGVWLLGDRPEPEIAGVIFVALDERLNSPERPAESQPTSSLSLSYQGRGTLAGHRAAPRLSWEAGRLEVEVEPGTDTRLVVQTREALIQVVGTVFTVTRSGPRTDVEVHRGEVHVRCAAGGGAELLAGQQHRCGPASEAGWLALAHQLRGEPDQPERALQAVDAGLDMADPSGVVATELLVLRAQLLADAGRLAEALVAIEEALERPHSHRRSQLLVLGLALAEALGDQEAMERWVGQVDRSTPVPGPVP